MAERGEISKDDYDHARLFTENNYVCEDLVDLKTKSRDEELEQQRVLKSNKLMAKGEFERDERQRRKGRRR